MSAPDFERSERRRATRRLIVSGAIVAAKAAKDTFAPDDPSAGRARQVKHTTEPLSLNPEQREKLREIIGTQNTPRDDRLPISLEVGEAVPPRDKLVIVDRLSRRVAAIVPDVT